MQTFFRIALALFVTLTWQVLPAHSQVGTTGDTIDVMATGIGIDQDAALRSAFRSAVQQAVGALISTETLIANEEVVSDQILSFSAGFVESYEQVGEPRTIDGLVSIQIAAKVKRNDLNDRLHRAGVIQIAMDGRSLAGERLTREMSRADATEMLLDLLENFPANVYDFSTTWRYDLDTRRVIVDVETRINARRYAAFVEEFTEMLPFVGGRAGGSVPVQLTRGESPTAATGGALLQRVERRLIEMPRGSIDNVAPMPTVQVSISRSNLLDRQTHGFVVADSWANFRVAGQQFPVNFQFYTVPEEVFRMICPMFERRNMTVRAMDSNGNILASGTIPAPAPSFNARSQGPGFYVNQAMRHSNLVFIFPSLCIEPHRVGTVTLGPTLRPGMPEGKQQVFLDMSQAQMERTTAIQISLE
jgi:hypothetical protein